MDRAGAFRLKLRLVRLSLPMVCVLVYLFLLAPIFVVISTSLTTTPYVLFPPRGVTLHWYEVALTEIPFLQSILLSLLLALAVTISTLLLGASASLALVRWPLPGREVVLTLFLSPILIPTVVSGIALLQFFAVLGLLGSLSAILLAHTILSLAYVVRILTATFQTLNPALEESAFVLGANRLQTFKWVILPLLQKAFLAAGVFAFVVSFDEIVIVNFIAGPNTTTFPLRLYSHISEKFDPIASVYSTLLILLALMAVLAIGRTVGLETFGGDRSSR